MSDRTISDDSNSEQEDSIRSIDEVDRLIRSLSPAEVEEITRLSTFVGTNEGEVSGQPSTILQDARVDHAFGENYNMSITSENQLLEFSVVVTPRIIKNGPDGSAVLPHYRDAERCPDGITVELLDNGRLMKYAVLDGKEWSCFVWDDSFQEYKEKTFEWAVSGLPVTDYALGYSNEVFTAVEERVKMFAHNRGLPFGGNLHNPSHKMFLFAQRSVLLENAAPLDEGRPSEYPDPWGLLATIGPERDLKYNRIPEVLVLDHSTEQDRPMSFHDLHLLGTNILLQLIITPRVFIHKQTVKWNFRLIGVKVVGKPEVSQSRISPSKKTNKRKSFYLGDSSQETSPSKRQNVKIE